MRQMLLDSVNRIFSTECSTEVLNQSVRGVWPQSLWDSLESNGFTQVGEEGMSWADALSALQVAGYYACPVPLAESYLATKWLENAGGTVPQGVLTVGWAPTGAPAVVRESGTTRITGMWKGVPWGREADYALLMMNDSTYCGLALVAQQDRVSERHQNLAGEPRDTLYFQQIPVLSYHPLTEEQIVQFQADAAATRVMLAVGAVDRVLEMTLEYANQRTQFGRAIGRFQAVQHQIAEMAAEAASIRAAANRVLQSLDENTPGRSPDQWLADVALSKIRLAQAVRVVTAVAHQVHGAIGFTEEYALHHFTRRLWSWRHEYGNDTYWSRVVMGMLAHVDPWDLLTGTVGP